MHLKATCIYCLFQAMYARAVWVENGRETKGTVPDNWIDINKNVKWPNTKVKETFKMKKDPQDDWLTFRLIKRKMTSSKFRLNNGLKQCLLHY